MQHILCFDTSKFSFLMFSSIHVFRPEGQIWEPVRRDTKIYVRLILNSFRTLYFVSTDEYVN